MSKNYTAEEFAKKFSISKGHVYELIKRGQISKVPNLGKTIRIPSRELEKMKATSNNLLYLPERVEAVKTSLGTIRKIKGKDLYVLVDVVKALGVNNSYRIIRTIGNDFVAKLTTDEARDLGLFANQTGILLISSTGIKLYSSKCRNRVVVENFIKELIVNAQAPKGLTAPIEVKEKEIGNTQSALQIFEGQEVEIIEVTGEILFELYSTGMALGQIKKNSEGRLYPRKERIDGNIISAGIKPRVHNGHKYLTEPMLYDFMLEAKTQKCRPFRNWVTNDVLPSIRKTGAYTSRNVEIKSEYRVLDDTYLNFSADTVKLMIKDLRNSNLGMLEKVRMNNRSIAKLESLLEGGI
ncbi:BRO family protein [Clostridium pasteurianum]|uniref:Prophage antirepressor n=1 Tax=Clostridium pasteurianum BC1 TaxID=86416 RepID=R4K1G8_CLOPA|nr:BRO family protein [Clostridium pasteurianum]AGK95601.1 prophage antirepressor [Clostridium pasteurianum BC1]